MDLLKASRGPNGYTGLNLKGTLMQIWKFANIFVFIWK